jgi:hypothetical protein
MNWFQNLDQHLESYISYKCAFLIENKVVINRIVFFLISGKKIHSDLITNAMLKVGFFIEHFDD